MCFSFANTLHGFSIPSHAIFELPDKANKRQIEQQVIMFMYKHEEVIQPWNCAVGGLVLSSNNPTSSDTQIRLGYKDHTSIFQSATLTDKKRH